MIRSGVWPLTIRVVSAVIGLAVLGLALRLVGAILRPLLPAQLMTAVDSGWNYLFTLVSPAIGPLGALIVLVLLIWIVLGRR